jgi:cyclomaltodextrinase / maltogenic alpha-amylase / neopullulanase
MPIDTPDWVRDAVFYQIFPDRFAISDRVPKPGPLEPWDAPPTWHGFKGGDLLGVVERLDYLQALGITALYLTPVFASASNHRYHTYDYFQVDPLLGGEAALRELLDAAHGRGMRVVLDGVFNHTGRGHWAFHHVLEAGAASPYRHWYHFDQGALEQGRPVLAYPGAHRRSGVAVDDPGLHELGSGRDGGPSFETLGYRAWWDLPALPKLNTDNPAVREHLWAAAEHWIRFGIDGWRLDVPEEIDDRGFWQEFRRRVRAANPEAYTVGEIWHVAPDWLSGDRFDALMNYPLGEAILSFVGGRHLDHTVIGAHNMFAPTIRREDGPAFAQRLTGLLSAYPREVSEVQLNLLDSHDTPRAHTMLSCDRAGYRLAVLLQATLPGAPCVYYGDEVGLEGGNDPDCRRAFPAEAAWDRELLAYVSAALAMRAAQPALRRGSWRIAGAAGEAVAMERSIDGSNRLVVALNAGEERVTLGVELPGLQSARLKPLDLPGWPMRPAAVGAEGRADLVLAPRSGGVWGLA